VKTVGIIGGIGPESTIEYYRSIIALYRETKPDGSYPSIILNSIDLQRMLDLIAGNDLTSVTDYLVGEVQKLARAEADFGLLAAGTPHLVFEAIRSRAEIPLLSIVEVTCEAAKVRGLHRVGLFGTRFTMQSHFYSDVFSKGGIQVVVPSDSEQLYIHEKYFAELVNGIVLEETRQQLLLIVRRMREADRIEGLILGGTELSLILRDQSSLDIPILDSTQLHVKSVVAELLK
jgi:aspartate racemase